MANNKPHDNALQHGLTSERVVLPQLGETVTDWEAFRDGWQDVLKPRNVPERELCNRIAGLAWRLRRAEAWQRLYLTRAELPGDNDALMELLREAHNGVQLTQAVRDQRNTLGRAMTTMDGDRAERAQRYETTLERQLQRSLALYDQLRGMVDRAA